MTTPIRSLAVALACLFAACHAPAEARGAGNLYARLGGDVGVAAISSSLIDRVASDPSLGRSFKDSNLSRIKKLLAEQICDLSGGPCHYSGDSMKEVHAGHHISEAEFYGMVSTLRDILRERRVDLGATNELLRLLAPMKRDVVESAQTEGKR
jgi:hemoglobin